MLTSWHQLKNSSFTTALGNRSMLPRPASRRPSPTNRSRNQRRQGWISSTFSLQSFVSNLKVSGTAKAQLRAGQSRFICDRVHGWFCGRWRQGICVMRPYTESPILTTDEVRGLLSPYHALRRNPDGVSALAIVRPRRNPSPARFSPDASFQRANRFARHRQRTGLASAGKDHSISLASGGERSSLAGCVARCISTNFLTPTWV